MLGWKAKSPTLLIRQEVKAKVGKVRTSRMGGGKRLAENKAHLAHEAREQNEQSREAHKMEEQQRRNEDMLAECRGGPVGNYRFGGGRWGRGGPCTVKCAPRVSTQLKYVTWRTEF